MKTLTVEFAGLVIRLENCMAYTEVLFRGYETNKEPLFSVSVTGEELRAEMTQAELPVREGYAQAICFHRKIAEQLPLFDRVLFHGAAVAWEGHAYVFTAPSGTGKSTHIGLWKRFLGDGVTVINGDKPTLSFPEGRVIVHGTPYAGKEGWKTNTDVPLAGICFLSRGKENVISRMAPREALHRLYGQTYHPDTKEALEKTLDAVGRMCGIPCFGLECDISEEAVRTSFEALTGQRYEEHRK